jgi:hypothetical protein
LALAGRISSQLRDYMAAHTTWPDVVRQRPTAP